MPDQGGLHQSLALDKPPLPASAIRPRGNPSRAFRTSFVTCYAMCAVLSLEAVLGMWLDIPEYPPSPVGRCPAEYLESHREGSQGGERAIRFRGTGTLKRTRFVRNGLKHYTTKRNRGGPLRPLAAPWEGVCIRLVTHPNSRSRSFYQESHKSVS